ncbi:MAG: hypothetical protein ACQR33_07110 [Candidatus Saccharibacteria bacterium]
MNGPNPLSQPIMNMIDALADQLVADYLRPQAAAGNDPAPARPNPVPLPTTAEAA